MQQQKILPISKESCRVYESHLIIRLPHRPHQLHELGVIPEEQAMLLGVTLSKHIAGWSCANAKTTG